MVHLTAKLPPHLTSEGARVAMAVKLYEIGRLSLAQAAASTGHTKRAFLELLGNFDVSVISSPVEDTTKEVGA